MAQYALWKEDEKAHAINRLARAGHLNQLPTFAKRTLAESCL